MEDMEDNAVGMKGLWLYNKKNGGRTDIFILYAHGLIRYGCGDWREY